MLVESPFFKQPSITHLFRTINFPDPADKTRHDRMVALVTQMLELNKKLQDATLDHEKRLQGF